MSERFNEEELEYASDVFKSIAHPIRLRILNLLVEEKVLNVSTVSEILGLDQPLVSHHLGILKRSGIVEAKRQGREISYNLALPELSDMLDCIDLCLKRK